MIFEKIRKAFNNICKKYIVTDEDLVWNRAIYKCETIVAEVQAEYNNGWIPCSERLPEEYVEVLAYGRDGYIYLATMYDTKIYGKVWKQWNGGELRLDWIIAWQPLPEPYTPKGEWLWKRKEQ